MLSLRALVVCCACALPLSHAAAQDAAPADAPAARPRVGLVLSGGGARGLAHIGVLRVLRDMRVPVDIVVGTSMGGVIGGAYAAGASVADLERMARDTSWDRVVADRQARDDLAFRRREEDQLLPSRIEFGLSRDGVSLPPAAAGNAALELALNRLLPDAMRDRPVNSLPLPFRSVASDLITGELVELDDTPLFLSVRASLAVPGVFAPVRIKQRLVVDGGLVRNLPVDMARAMGAEIVIAVNVGTPLAPEKELGSAIGVAQQMLQILTEQNVQRSIRELGPGDILLAPDLNGISFLDFGKQERAMRAGAEAARALALRLAPLALPEREYAALEALRLAAPVLADVALPLARLEVQSGGGINERALAAQSGLVEGSAVTREEVRRAGARLYGRGDLARVETEVSDAGDQRSVLIKATPSEWAGSRLRVGLELGSDFNDNNKFALKVMHVASSLNAWGAEWRTIGRIGTERSIETQWWQPLGAGSPWYIAPSLRYSSAVGDKFMDGLRNYRYAYDLNSATLALGRGLGSYGDVQIGIRRNQGRARQVIPEMTAGMQTGLATDRYIAYRIDTLDSLAFPTRGFMLDATWASSVDSGAERGPAERRTAVTALSAFHTENWAGHVYAEWARGQSGAAPLQLGGFLRLSGVQENSIEGRSVLLSRLVMARRIGAVPSTLGGAIRAGFSLEAGGAFDQSEPWQRGRFTQSVSAFLSVDTRFGPFYAGAGASKRGTGTFYLFLGPIW
ncbi:patatin-like phospholipase family protein [Janthinobacterium fluminis]|uniref:Patatin-like phospholipase family protein n=1 Tax=Janthinobacterium fluminis TaxID=2987524 RepID=A0ABT5K6C4_9BURK|nr:patatin-like phospholipase family protein [Janthinobacterium fluminis]MDC8760454.1 patatin-like phospholipase family protein [Janthinobacterium fluminis]